MSPTHTYRFRTTHNGVVRIADVQGVTAFDALRTLRAGLYDGETIVGWA